MARIEEISGIITSLDVYYKMIEKQFKLEAMALVPVITANNEILNLKNIKIDEMTALEMIGKMMYYDIQVITLQKSIKIYLDEERKRLQKESNQ